MKLLLYILAHLSFTICVGQTHLPVDRITKKVVYSDSITLQKSKDKLYKNAKKWLLATYKDYRAIIEIENPSLGRLAVKAVSQIKGNWYTKIRYKLQIDVKDNKYKCIISNIEQNLNINQNITIDQLDHFSTVDNVNNDLVEIERSLKETNEYLPLAKNERERSEIEKSQYELSESRRRKRQFIRETNSKAAALIASLRKQMLAQTNK